MLERFELARRPGGILQIGRWGRGRLAPDRRIWHPTTGRGEILGPDGEVLHVGEWHENTLHDQGEQSMLDVYLRAQSNPAKYLGLLGEVAASSLADTLDMGDVTEVKTPGTDGYSRQQITSGDWAAPVLDSGDYQTTAAQKSFGPNTGGGNWAVSHTFLTTTSTGTGGLLILSVPQGSVQEVVPGNSYRHTLTFKQS